MWFVRGQGGSERGGELRGLFTMSGFLSSAGGLQLRFGQSARKRHVHSQLRQRECGHRSRSAFGCRGSRERWTRSVNLSQQTNGGSADVAEGLSVQNVAKTSLELSPLDDDGVQFVVTVVGTIGAGQIDAVTKAMSTMRVQVRGIRRLCSGAEMHAVEVVATGPLSSEIPLRAVLQACAQETGVDAVLQREGTLRRSKRLAIFDLDSTLIQMETADTIAKFAGKEEECSAITAQAMQGDLDFEESLKHRVALLKGLDEALLESVKESVVYTQGVHRLIKVLSKLGCKTIICSGGFTFLTDHVRQNLDMDASYSNILEVKAGKLTGKVQGPIVDSQKKEDILRTLRTFLHLQPEQVLAVGDGANDLPMLAEAGLGVAFNAKPKVRRLAAAQLNQKSMDSILYLLGLTDDEIENLATD